MAGTRGFTSKPLPAGADERTYRPGIKRERARLEAVRQSNFDALPEEEKQRRRDAWAAELKENEHWRSDFDEFGPAKALELKHQRQSQRRALEKLVDREARIAVEGDTDSNHDNIEAAQ